EHHLGVDEVLGTAKRDQPYFHGPHNLEFRMWNVECVRIPCSSPNSTFQLPNFTVTDTACTASSDTESSPARARACRSTTRRARCPCRSRRAAPCRSGGDRGTPRTLPAAGCVP